MPYLVRFCAVPLLLVLAASAALASDLGNPGTPDANYGLKTLQTFTTKAEAAAHCPGDEVVWAERYAGFFYLQNEDKYGRAPQGAYACRTEAKAARYWGTSLADAMGEYRGKEMRWEYNSY